VVRTRVAARLAHTASWSPNGSSTTGTYKVKDGDTLSSIAVAHRTTWRKLWALNKTTLPNPHAIKRDQVIKLK
jgi:LysM repeat protein